MRLETDDSESLEQERTSVKREGTAGHAEASLVVVWSSFNVSTTRIRELFNKGALK